MPRELYNDGEYLYFLNTLSEYGLGQYMEFFKSIKVYDGSSFHKRDFVMSSNNLTAIKTDDSYHVLSSNNVSTCFNETPTNLVCWKALSIRTLFFFTDLKSLYVGYFFNFNYFFNWGVPI